MSIYLDSIHPGEILLEDFLKPLGISINKLEREIDVPPGRWPCLALARAVFDVRRCT